MRLFVAVEIDDRARRVAEAVEEQLQGALNSTLKARWVPPANMHLTVRFIGHVDDRRAPAVIEALAPPLAIAPFDIELGACGVFPPKGAPRALWIGLTQGLPSLALMCDAFNRRLRPLGLEPEARPFSAHLTLARIKDAPGGAGRAVSDALGRVAVPAARFQVARATVFQSHLSPKGPRYEPVALVPLNG
jgi:RNA 2',3'-cyclic 3'-phosphodiesterase